MAVAVWRWRWPCGGDRVAVAVRRSHDLSRDLACDIMSDIINKGLPKGVLSKHLRLV